MYLAALGIRSFAWAHPLPLRYLLEHQSQQYLGTKCHLANGLWLPDTVTASRHTPAHQSCHPGDAECLNHGTHGTSTCTFCTGEGDLCQASSSLCLRASQGKATSSQSTNKLAKQVFFPVLSLNVLNGARVALSFPPWRRAGVASTPSRDKAPDLQHPYFIQLLAVPPGWLRTTPALQNQPDSSNSSGTKFRVPFHKCSLPSKGCAHPSSPFPARQLFGIPCLCLLAQVSSHNW